MIWNPGQLPAGLDGRWQAGLKAKHSSQPFNPDIANVFFRAGEIEAWGRGIERILGACREADFPEPEIEYETTGLWISFPCSRPRSRSGTASGETPGKTRVETRVETPERILKLLRVRPQLTLDEVAIAIGKSTSAVERAASKLVKESRLRFVGPRKGGHWEVNS